MLRHALHHFVEVVILEFLSLLIPGHAVCNIAEVSVAQQCVNIPAEPRYLIKRMAFLIGVYIYAGKEGGLQYAEQVVFVKRIADIR